MKKVEKKTKLNDRGWMLLLTEISKGNVIPIIGDELFKVKEGDEVFPLKKYISKKLAEQLNVEYEEGVDSTQLSSKFYEPYWDAIDSDPYYETTQIMKDLDAKGLEVSDTLKSLLSIDKFKLVLTISLSESVFRVMEEVWGKGKVKNLYYEKHSGKEDIEDDSVPTCYHMFGKVNVCPNSFVLSEDNLLEFIGDWMSDGYRPKKLFNLLREKYLLVIGCNYPDWLFRFFFHSMKSSVRSSSAKTGLVADSKLDGSLVGFLSRMSTSIHDDAEAFIEELVVRYRDFDKEEKSLEVFISYASEDYEQANAVAENFRRLGAGVWFDKVELEPGDEYAKKIRKNIEDCKAFVPILSKNVLDKGRRFYKREWAWAKEEIEWRGTNKFIYPVRIDDVNLEEDVIASFYSSFHTFDFSSEQRDENVKKIIRDVRSSRS